MLNKITVHKPAALDVSSPGIHPIDCTTYNRRRLAAAGSWNFDPLTVEQIEKARIDFVRGCAEEKHDVKISASWRPGAGAISEAKQDVKISKALNEAIQAPMNQDAMTAAIEMMKIEIKDGQVKVPVLEDEHSNLFKKPGVDEPIDVELKFTYEHMPWISAALLREKKTQMADCKLNGVMVKNMTLVEFQAVWAQQIEEQKQHEAKRLMLDRLAEAAARQEISRDQVKNPCVEIALGEPEPDVLTSALAEKQKRLEENLAKLKAGQTLNESQKVMMKQHLDELQLRLSLKKKENHQADVARRTEYKELATTHFQAHRNDLHQIQSIRDEIDNIVVAIMKPPTPRGISGDDIRPEGEPIKRKSVFEPEEVRIDLKADCVILKSVDQAQDRMQRHWEAYDGPKSVAIGYESKQLCPDCGGSGEYVGFNHTEICPSCKGSKVV